MKKNQKQNGVTSWTQLKEKMHEYAQLNEIIDFIEKQLENQKLPDTTSSFLERVVKRLENESSTAYMDMTNLYEVDKKNMRKRNRTIERLKSQAV